MTGFSMIHHENMVTTVTVAQDPSASLQPERPYAFHPYRAWAMWPPPAAMFVGLKNTKTIVINIINHSEIGVIYIL
jgi:hypothetical protein